MAQYNKVIIHDPFGPKPIIITPKKKKSFFWQHLEKIISLILVISIIGLSYYYIESHHLYEKINKITSDIKLPNVQARFRNDAQEINDVAVNKYESAKYQRNCLVKCLKPQNMN